jgi:hypothetical protein
VDAVLGPRRVSGLPEARGDDRASEVVRAAPSEKTTLQWGGIPEGNPDAPLRKERSRLTVSRAAEAGPAPSSAGQSRSDCRKVVRRLAVQPLLRVDAQRGRHGESRVLGSRAIHGCSCRRSIAEVGKKHLSQHTEASRKANRGVPGVARVGGASPRRGRVDRFGRQGCEELRANVTGIATLFARPQGRESSRRKASWVHVRRHL